MSIFYTDQELKALDRIMEVFSDYIAQARHFSVVWSKQTGYLFMNLDSDGDLSLEPAVVEGAEELCLRLFREIAKDVLVEQNAQNLEPSTATDRQKLFIRQRLEPYLQKLPKYRALAEELF